MQLYYMKVICFTCRIIPNMLVLNYNWVTYQVKYAFLGLFSDRYLGFSRREFNKFNESTIVFILNGWD